MDAGWMVKGSWVRRAVPGWRGAFLGILVAWISVLCAGCGAPPPVELPSPDSGCFLTLEEQQALSEAQLKEYCQMLDDHLVSLRRDIKLAKFMTDSLSTVLDSITNAHGRVNAEARELEKDLRRIKAARERATVYRTQAGDTLMKLSSLFYGTAADWRKIYEANRDKIKDPGVPLLRGLDLTIPR
ncbi:MAG: LysM peptidoglycan-binding domain-containing protein [Candidatus Eisenbacteria sp.]|nr:LysM peptidoglycan-binding domain-containing protein [Candidatus Eisenbacteria bacterium]